MRKYTVYRWTNTINQKSYVGVTSRSLAVRSGKDGAGYKRTLMYEDIEKYGWENFESEILFITKDRVEASKKEKEMIKKYNTRENGYNIQRGGSLPHEPNEHIKRLYSKEYNQQLLNIVVEDRIKRTERRRKNNLKNKKPKKIV